MLHITLPSQAEVIGARVANASRVTIAEGHVHGLVKCLVNLLHFLSFEIDLISTT